MPLRLLLRLSCSRQTFLILVVALGSLLSSCRSEQVAFHFRPEPGAARPISLPALPSTHTTEAGSAPEVAYTAPITVARHRAASSQPKIKSALPSRPRLVHRRLLATPRYLLSRPAAASKPKGAAIHETRHLLLGIAVVVVGVVTGLLLGGWLGLGVGALIVILGYYFLGLAFGGEHAWLEVFQEFFNM